MSSLQRHALIAFGSFQLDVEAGELRKRGMKIKLQSQPFRVLTTLLSKPGEVITREELQHAIWGVNTSVDFERGLASAINKLREALGDSAESPRYVETLARRGYRFIAPVILEAVIDTLPEVVRSPDERSGSSHDLPSKPLVDAPFQAPPAVVQFKEKHMLSVSRSTALAFLTFALALIGIASLLVLRSRHSPGLIRGAQIAQLTRSGEIFAGLPDFENFPVLATDGPRVYTPTFSGGRAKISSLELSDGLVLPVSIPDELGPVSIADISKDGSKLLLRSRRSQESEQALWVVPTSGSSALRVGEITAHDASWMPEGKDVLYATGNDLNIAQLDTGVVSVMARLPGRAFWLRWSPDGHLLRYTLVDPITHSSNLWEWDASKRRAHPLNFPELTGLALCCGSWTADGKTFVFESSSTQGSNIWSVGVGANPVLTQLTNGPLRFIAPFAARAGRTIYFVGLDPPADTRLYNQRLQSFEPAPAYLRRAQRVTYSRDGLWVAWADGESRLWRARSSDGSQKVQLTPDDLEVFLAQWSPDDTHLVLMAKKPGETWRIYVVSAGGGTPRLLLADNRNLADPDWSADGRRLVLGREADLMGKEEGSHDLEIFDLASQKVQTLAGSENLFSPRWSPDGRWIVALSLDQTRLMLYNIQRQSWQVLFNGGAADPVWTSDSSAVDFHAFALLGSPILRVSLGGTTQSITDLTKIGLPEGDVYFFSGVTPNGSPLIKPRVGTGNLYSLSLSP